MSKIPRVVRVWVDDWERIYLDGKLWREGHRLCAREWLELMEACGISTVSTELIHDDSPYKDVYTEMDQITQKYFNGE